jgi:hypothetical protein
LCRSALRCAAILSGAACSFRPDAAICTSRHRG